MTEAAGYRTYIMGTDAITLFDTDFLKTLKPYQWLYISNWRVLHIDGFEGGYYALLPRQSIHKMQLSMKAGERTFDGSVDWTNFGKA